MAARGDGLFEDVADLLTRLDLRKVNRRVIETLVRCGAMDCFGHTRASLMQGLDALLEVAQSRKADRDSGQIGLFDAVPRKPGAADGALPRPVPEWPTRELLAAERETLGYYVSGHPMDPFVAELERHDVKRIADLPSLVGQDVMVAGVVIARNEKLTRGTQQKFAYVTIEDPTGQVECFVGSRTHEQWAAVSETDEPLLIRGAVRLEGEEEDVVRVTVTSIQRLEVARRSMYRMLELVVDLSSAREATIDAIRDAVLQRRGPCPVLLALRLPGVGEMRLRAGSSWGVDPSDATVAAFEKVVGAGNAVLR
jgi:DNA polymerase-3 subunit alpha